MRTYDEMMKLIMDKAINDDRIRAVVMNGSRADSNAVHDEYSDFDICYIVKDIREFTNDKKWIEYFGKILIVQYPMDWYSHPYDYASREKFTYLMQFDDGNRIDLTLIDCTHIKELEEDDEPRVVLLNKDHFKELYSIESNEAFYISKPSQMEYDNTCNELRWLSLYVSKGLCRKEIYYAKDSFDNLLMPMFMKMLNWRIAMANDFKVTTGNHSKYLKRFLSEQEMRRFQGILPNGEYEDIWEKLFLMYDYFTENAKEVAETLGFTFDTIETANVRQFLVKRFEKDYEGY